MGNREARPLKVLIVEDNLVFRHMLRESLAASFPAADLREAGGVAEGKILAAAERPDVLLLDLSLPDGNGLDLAEWCSCDLPGTAVAICTCHDLPEYREAAKRRRASAFFSKHSFDWPAVERFVRGVWERLRGAGSAEVAAPLVVGR